MESFEKNNIFVNILKGLAISIVFTLVCLIIFSVLLVYTDLSESLIEPVIIVITGISILLGSSIGNRKAVKNGMISGAIIGLLYIFCIYIISSIVNAGNFSLSLNSVIMMIASLIGGAIGGIIGVNIK